MLTIKNYIWILISCCALKGNAQAPGDSAKKWHFLLEPYYLFASTKGAVGLGTSPGTDIDQSIDDIFDNLTASVFLYFEMHNKKWYITSDLMFMKQSWVVTKTSDVSSGTVDIRRQGWELALLHSLLPWLDGGLGVQFKSIKLDADLVENTSAGPTPKSYGLTQSWADPVIIARAKFPLGKRWLITGRGDIGGFTAGSDLTWQLQGYAHFSLSRVMVVSAGYRALYVDYENGLDSDHFLYKVTTMGPVLGLGFRF